MILILSSELKNLGDPKLVDVGAFHVIVGLSAGEIHTWRLYKNILLDSIRLP